MEQSRNSRGDRRQVLRDGGKTRFGEIVTDSTKVKTGSVFVALKGERHDGHRFVGDAVRRGAGVRHRASCPAGEYPRQAATAIKVRDTLKALGDLAHYRRQQFAPKVLAITGSNGKTTTKEMVAAILEEAIGGGQSLRGKILKTEGNFNNLVGLPLDAFTFAQARQDRGGRARHQPAGRDSTPRRDRRSRHRHHYFGRRGASRRIEQLGGCRAGKRRAYRDVRPNGTIAVNLDDPWVGNRSARFQGRKITYGKARSGARGSSACAAARMEVHCASRPAALQCALNYLGQHNIANALGAAALSLGVGANLAAVRRGLEKVRAFSMRMQIEDWRGVGIINDAYNANPASMKAALQTLAEFPCHAAPRSRSSAICSSLGKHSAKEHRQLGRAQPSRRSMDCSSWSRKRRKCAEARSMAAMGAERIVSAKTWRSCASTARAR